MNNNLRTIKNILLPLVVGGLVGLLTSGSFNLESLVKPPLVPPASLFPIVWTILYLLMGIGYAIIDRNGDMTERISTIFYAQLIVNALWPIAFFVLEWRLFAFFWLVLLDFLIILMIRAFYEKSPLAAYLQIPYLVWCLFATYLNLGFFILNM